MFVNIIKRFCLLLMSALNYSSLNQNFVTLTSIVFVIDHFVFKKQKIIL